MKTCEEFVDHQAAEISADEKTIDEKQLPVPEPQKIDRAKAAAVVDFCHAMLCSNEFLYVD